MAQGRYDAFVFAQECGGDKASLKEKIDWYEELMTNPPDDWKGPMSPNSSVRMHKDGYLPGLKDALKILLQAEQSQPQAAMARVAESAASGYQVTGKGRHASAANRKKKAREKPTRQSKKPNRKPTA